MVPISSDSTNPVAGRGMGSAEVHFKALPSGHPDIKKANQEAKPDHTQRIEIR
jgi:hypothetical protein